LRPPAPPPAEDPPQADQSIEGEKQVEEATDPERPDEPIADVDQADEQIADVDRAAEPIADVDQADAPIDDVDRTDEPVADTERPAEPVAAVDQAVERMDDADPDEAEQLGCHMGRLLGLPIQGLERQFRELAEKILCQFPPGRPAAVVFTSPGEGEGKTGTLAPLAVALADRKEGEILAVDCNFHRPALAERFGIEPDRGLLDVLSGAASWREVVRQTDFRRLSVLPAGRLAAGDDAPWDTPKLAAMLDSLRRQYRLVLIDTASLGHREVAPMTRLCDGTYLVIRLGRTRRSGVRRALRAVEAGGGRLLGCVLTNAPNET